MTTVYTVRGPNGEKYKVTGPDDATDDELIDQVQKYLTPKTGLSGSVQKGLEGLTSSIRTAAGAAFGDPNVAAREALEREKTAAIRYPEQVSMEKVKEAYQRGLLPAAGEVLRQFPHAIAEQLPQLGTTLASGMAGARLGALTSPVTGPLGPIIGGLGGMAAPSLVQQLGGNIQRQAQEQTEAGKPIDINMLRAAGAAVPQAGLDILETRLLLGSKLFKGLTGKALGEVTKEQAEQLAKDGLLKTLAKGTVRGVVSEVPTEVTQQMLERWQAGLDLTSPEALAEYGATAYQTALLGPLGIPGQFAQRSQARDMVAPPQSDQTTQPGQPPADQEKYVEPPPFVEKDTTAAVEAPAVSKETLKKKVDDLSLEELPGVIAHYEQRLATGEFKGEKHKANTEAKLAKVRTRLEELQAVPQEAAPEEIAEEEAAPEVTAPTPGVITENVLGSLGVKGQGSRKVKKALLGLDLNTQAGQETFDNLFQLPGLRFDQEAVTALRGTVENLAPAVFSAASPVSRQPKKQPAPKPAEGPQDGDNADRAATGEGAGVPVQGATATPGASPTELLGVGEPQPAAGGPAQVPAGGDVALRQEQAKAKADVEAAIQAQMNANAQALKNAEKEVKKRETRRLKDIGGKAKTALENEPEPKEKSKGDALLRRDGLMLLAKENITPRDYTLGVENLVDAKANDLLKLFGIPKKDIVAAKARLEATKTDALIEESFEDLASPLSRNLYNAHLDFLLDEPRKDKKEEIIQRLGKAGVSKQELAQAETRISNANLARQVAASKRDKTKKDLDQRQRGERRDVARLQERYFDLQEEIAFAQDQVNELKVRGEPYQAEEDHVYSQKVALEEVKAQAKERGVTFPDSRSGIQYSRIMGEGRPSPTGNTAANVAKEVERILRPGSRAERITTVVQSVGQLPEDIRNSEGFSPAVRGAAYRGRVYLVADNIDRTNVLGVFLHEAGAHIGFDQVMSKEDRQFLSDQVRQWAKGDDLKGQAAKKALAKGGTNNDEIIAYAVEELVNRGVKPVGFRPEANWLRRVLYLFNQALKKIGLRQNITAQELVDAAFGAAMQDSIGSAKGVRLSVKSEKMGAKGTAKAWVEFAEANKIVDFGKIKTVDDARQAAETDYKNTISQIPEFDADTYLAGAMEMEEQFLPEAVKEAVRQYKAGDKENAVGKLLADVKIARKENIERWKNYIENVNEDARVDPFWRSYVARSIIKSFDVTKPNTGETFNAAALAEVYGKFLDGNAPNFTKAYRAAKMRATADLVELGDANNGWRKVPQTKKDSPDFKERVAQVQAISSETWCTKTYNAGPYIQKGDFWVYVNNGRPELAIRFEGNDVAEIQGRDNNGSIPYQYANMVNKLVDSKKLNVSERTKNELHKATEEAKKIHELLKDVVSSDKKQHYTLHTRKDGKIIVEVTDNEKKFIFDDSNKSDTKNVVTVIGITQIHNGSNASSLTTVFGEADIFRDASAPALTMVRGYVDLYEGASAPALTTVGGSIYLNKNAVAPALTTAGGGVALYEGASVPALTTVGKNVTLHEGASAPALTTVGGSVVLYEGASAPALTTVGGSVVLYKGASAPALTMVDGDVRLYEGASAPAKVQKPSEDERVYLHQLSTEIRKIVDSRLSQTRKPDQARFSTGSAALDAGVVRRNQDLTRQKDKPIFQQILDALASTKDRQRLIDKVDVAIADISGPLKRNLLDHGMDKAAMGLAFATKSTDVAATSMITGAIKLSRNTNQFTVVKGPSLRSVYDQVQEIAKAIGGKDNQKAFTDAMRVFDLGATVLRERSLPADQQGLVKFRPEDIAAGEEALRLYRGQINKGMDAWTAYKNGLLDAAQVAGRLSAEEVHELKKAVDYVPWYRVLDDAQYGFDVKTSTKQYFRSLQDSGRIHELMGGSAVDRPVGNILDNMEKLSFWLVNASMKNYAATNVVDSLLTLDAEEIGSKDALKTPKGVPVEKSRVVQIYRNGEKKFYQLGDELDAAAFLPVQEITTPLMKFAGKAGNFLRKGVTYMPDFVVRQLFADAFRVTLYSGTNSPFMVGANTFAQYVREMKGDALSDKFAAYGITGRTDYIFDDDKSRVRAELGPTQNGIRRATTLTFKMLDRMTRASDAAQRRAIYEQTLKDTGNEQLALYKAIEIINFQNRGRNQVVSTLRHVVPFVNAYIQGMSIALRSMTGRGVSIQEKKQALATFYATAAKITALSAVYAGLVSGDDEYEKMPDYEKAGSFLIPGTRKMIKEFTGVDPGGSLRIPVPMDPAGFLFKLLPEAGVDTFLKEAAGSDVDYTKVRRLLGTAFVQAISPPNVVPQAVKPTLEVWANKSFFTGNPIVGRGLQDRAREQQFTSTTSELGKILGQHLPLAPVQIDYLIRGYLGAAGGSFLWATSAVLDPIVPGRERPSSRLNEVPVIKSFLTGREPTGMKEDYYELREKAAEVGNTVNLMARRDPEAALEYARKNMDYLKIQRSGVLAEIDKMLGEIRKARDFVDSNKDMSADQKRDMLDQLEQTEVLVLTRMQLPMLRKLAGM